MTAPTSEPAGLNLARAFDALAAAHPDRDAIVWDGGRHRRSWAEVADRAARFAGHLRGLGLTVTRERSDLTSWEAGQPLVAILLHNGPDYLEAMLGAYDARCAPFNVNVRSTPAELAYVIDDARAAVVVVSDDLRPGLDAALDLITGPAPVVLQSGAELDAAIAAAEPWRDPDRSPDDLYVLYTGGTTGKPKGVLWRQADFVTGALGLTVTDLDELVRAALKSGTGRRVLPAPPLMHGAAQWFVWSAWLGGGTVVFPAQVHRFDAASVLDAAAAERVSSLQVVGDSFARPLLDELHLQPRDLTALRFVVSGGAVLSQRAKSDLLEAIPAVSVIDILGSSESGRLAVGRDVADSFAPSTGATVLDESRSEELAAGSDDIGWLATGGRVPLGYLGDEVRTKATFPVVAGRRYSVPGDRARRRADGTIELLGRDASTINTGGEKVYAEEVESALLHHPDVLDVLVVGRPSERWGQEVVAVVALRAGSDVSDVELLAQCADLAGYKRPKAIVRRDAIARSPSGKPDYRWARTQAAP